MQSIKAMTSLKCHWNRSTSYPSLKKLNAWIPFALFISFTLNLWCKYCFKLRLFCVRLFSASVSLSYNRNIYKTHPLQRWCFSHQEVIFTGIIFSSYKLVCNKIIYLIKTFFLLCLITFHCSCKSTLSYWMILSLDLKETC